MLLRRYHDEPGKGRAEPEQETDGPPAKSAPKGEWVDYAVAQGATREDAEKSTKDALVERYGEV